MLSNYILFYELIKNQKITKNTLRRRFLKYVHASNDDYFKEELNEIINSLFKNVISK